MSHAFRLGLFIVATLSILAFGVFLIGSKDLLFHHTYELKSKFASVSGLAEGAEVRVGGLHEGTVKHIQLPRRAEDGVTVVMDLENDTRGVLKKDSVATIKSEGLVGDKYVEVTFGSEEAEGVKSGDTIAGVRSSDIADLLAKSDKMLDTAQTAVQNVAGAAANLKSISAKADQGKGTVGALINDRSVYDQARQGVAAFHDNMEALKHNFLLRGFFKHRGYEDAEEVTEHEIPRVPSAPALKSFTYPAGQLFKNSKTAKLSNPRILNDAGAFLEQSKFGLAVVAVSTGLKGDSEDQRQLSAARSAVVRHYLADNFQLDDSRIKTVGLGKTASAEASNRVEIMVYPMPAAQNERKEARARRP